MFFERIESRGLAHYSYIIGNNGKAVIIDPRLDCDVYIRKAAQNGLRITDILETHRNEDYVIGSVELSSRTGASVWHADGQLPYVYGKDVTEGQTWNIGGLLLTAVSTPGHTEGSISYLLHDPEGIPWMFFGGDTLFTGDVGRVDLLGKERMEEMAGLLYDTIFRKILPLGDEVLLCPAHGAGSVCGTGISDRIWTTIGMERKYNPLLQFAERKKFISAAARELERPPYFSVSEKANLEGYPLLHTVPNPPPLSPNHFQSRMAEAVVVDTRGELQFGAAHIPGVLSIWLEGLPAFAGWFLPYDKPLLLVTEGEDPGQAVRYLVRLGYRAFAGYLSGGMHSWHTAGKTSDIIRTITMQQFCSLRDTGSPAWILDVRSIEEVNTQAIPGAHHIHVTQLPGRMSEVPRNIPVFVFCASGLRSMVAASILKNAEYEEISVVLGGIAAWNSVSCPLPSEATRTEKVKGGVAE